MVLDRMLGLVAYTVERLPALRDGVTLRRRDTREIGAQGVRAGERHANAGLVCHVCRIT